MSEFDPFDEQLSDALGRRAGSGPASAAAAHEAVLSRASHIRRRRAAGVGAVTMISLLIGGIVLLPRGGGDTLAPSDTADVLPPVDVVDDSGNDDSATTVEVEGEESGVGPTTTTVDESRTPGSESVTSTSIPTLVPVTTGTSVADTTIATTSPTPPASSPSTSSPATSPSSPLDGTDTTTADTSTTTPESSATTSEPEAPPVAPFTKTYESVGGTITLRWNGSALSLLSVAPAVGFEHEIEDDEPLRIRVRFRGDDDDSRIEVRLSGGELVETIS